MKPNLAYLFAVALITISATTQAQEVVEIYSDLQSCDATVEGEAEGCFLDVGLLFQGRSIQNKTLALDGPGTWIFTWDVPRAEEGPYSVCAQLEKDGKSISQRCFDFYYGGRTDIRFDVRDFHADRKGTNLLIYSDDLAVVDIYYMLIDDGKALYISKDEAVPISGSMRSPAEINRVWKQLLENNQNYSGRVKIVETKNGQKRAFMNAFVAKDDAEITDTYEDETGASATVMGKSMVPFRGSLRFELYEDGKLTTSVEENTPILLSGDDETIEVSWNGTLDPGLYQLKIFLLGNDGDVIDLSESVIEAELRQNTSEAVETSEEKNSSPTTKAVGALILIALAVVVYLILRGRRS
jgi:hypothetical protein